MSKIIHRAKECSEYGCDQGKHGENWHIRGLGDALIGIVIGETVSLIVLFVFLLG